MKYDEVCPLHAIHVWFSDVESMELQLEDDE